MKRAAALVAFAATLAGNASAQDTMTSAGGAGTALAIEEIVVTARKREEHPLEVAESLTLFDANQIEHDRIDNLSEIGNLVPNMYMGVRADGLPNVTIRGIGAFGNTQGVGFYLDDVQLYSDASSNFGDIERIEVLKGPQGTLYGGSNIGGAVKFITRKPDPSGMAGSVNLGVGEDGYYSGKASLNVPLSADWAVRLFALAETDDSFLTNPNSPRLNGESNNNDPDAGWRDEVSARIALAGPLSDRLSLHASLRYSDLDAPNNYWVRELNPNLVYPRVLDTTFNPRHERETFAPTLELTYDLDSMAFTSLTAYTETESSRTVDIDLSQEYIIDSAHDQTHDTFSQEFRVASTGSGPLQWLAGAYFLDHEREERSNLLLGAAFFADAPTLEEELAPPFALPFRNYTQERRQTAAFGNFSYRWGDYEIAAGARLDRWKSKRFNIDSGLPGDQSDTEFLLRGSLTRFFDDDRSMVYGLISEGFEPGDFNLTNFTGAGSLFGYGPETATNFEVGYKGRLANDRAVLTLAAFLIDYEDRQFELQVDNPSGEGIVEGIINAGDSTHWGIEAELQWRMRDNWTLSGGFGYLNAEWDSGTVSPINNADLSGGRPPYTPEWSGTAMLSYGRELGQDRRVFGSLKMQYKDEITTNSQFLNVPGDDFPIWNNPAFTIFDLNFGMAWSDWEAFLLVENVFDEDYYIDAQEFPNFAAALIPQSAVIIGTVERTRRFMAVLKYRFGQ